MVRILPRDYINSRSSSGFCRASKPQVPRSNRGGCAGEINELAVLLPRLRRLETVLANDAPRASYLGAAVALRCTRHS
jgi:hypothetical protein